MSIGRRIQAYRDRDPKMWHAGMGEYLNALIHRRDQHLSEAQRLEEHIATILDEITRT